MSGKKKQQKKKRASKPPKHRGRPTDLTPETQAAIIEAIEGCNINDDAAAAAGIDPATFYRWMERGEAEERGPFREFCEAVKRARATASQKMVKRIQSASFEQWTAAAWLLERKDPKNWSLRLRQLLDEELNGALDKLKAELLPEEYRRVLAVLSGAPSSAALRAGASAAGSPSGDSVAGELGASAEPALPAAAPPGPSDSGSGASNPG